jgi:UDP-glucose 4-epimerase
MKKVLILGVNGFLGKQLCLELNKRNHCVTGYDIVSQSSVAELRNVQYICGNFVLADDFDELLVDVDTVFHLVSTTLADCGTDNICKEIYENVIPTIKLLDSMIRCGTRQIIFASSGGTVYGDTGKHVNTTDERLKPISSYGVQKKMIEACLELYGSAHDITYRIARIANIYGIGQDGARRQGVIPIFINRILNNLPITIYGNTYRDYIYKDDVVNAFVKLADYTGNRTVFNIGTGNSHSLSEVLDKICKLIGHDPIDVDVRPIRSFDVRENRLSVVETQDELNWHPEVSIEEGIAKIVDFCRNNCCGGDVLYQ